MEPIHSECMLGDAPTAGWREALAAPEASGARAMKRKPSDERMPVSTMRLPARTLLYSAQPRGESAAADSVRLPDGRAHFLRSPPATSAPDRLCEFSLQRAVTLVHGGDALDEERIRHADADGWCSADGGEVVLMESRSVLRLVDDDKQAGRVQATLRDMWWSQTTSPAEAQRWRSSMR
jgi:hypothetical protein